MSHLIATDDYGQLRRNDSLAKLYDKAVAWLPPTALQRTDARFRVLDGPEPLVTFSNHYAKGLSVIDSSYQSFT